MSKITWYYERLASMSGREIAHRVRKAVRRTPRPRRPPSSALANHLVFWDFAQVYGEVKLPEWLKSQYCMYAERRLAGKYDLFEQRDVYVERINWQKDYVVGKEAPLISSARLDYRDYARIGNIKYIWELNRHQFLPPVAIAYLITKDQRYKDYVLATVEDWIEQNPYMLGINWTSCLELSIRLMSWYYSISFLWSGGADLPRAFLEKLAQSVYEHAFHIRVNPSLYSSANNHLIGECAGIICASAMLRWPEISRWKDDAKTQLLEQSRHQVLADGVGAEQSPSYQAHTVGYYVASCFFLRASAEQVPSEFADLVRRSAQFYEAISDKNGHVPNIGDDDNGVPICLYARDTFNVYQSIINMSRILVARETGVAHYFDELSYWLFGDSIKGDWPVAKSPSVMYPNGKGPREFREGGYFVLGDRFGEDDEVKAVFDCGPLGFLSIAAHGHADALSFVLSYGGTEFFIDPGTYNYFVDSTIRNYFRGTAAHNTVRVDGRDQSEIGGPFLWKQKARSEIVRFECNDREDQVEGRHYGYTRLKDSAVHQRRMIYNKTTRSLEISDSLSMKGRHIIEIYFHLHRECTVERRGGDSLDVESNGRRITVRLDPQIHWDLFHGSTEPRLGWQSESFGELVACTCIRGWSDREGELNLLTRIQIR